MARGWAVARCELASFDGGIRRVEQIARPDRYRHLELPGSQQRRIVRGGGFSYAAASFGGGSLVQDCRAFNRLLSFDVERGILECEAGTTLGKVFQVAASRGWHLPVQPGYPEITVGGCIAADIHGKSQHADGNFRHWVRSLDLFHPDHGVLELDREREPGIFDLTCGGLGLTGQILSVRLQLARLPGRRLRIVRHRVPRFEETLALLAEHASRSAFLYSWHNFSAWGDGFGRGFVYSGSFIPGSSNAGQRRPRVIPIDSGRRGRGLPPALNGWTTAPFNHAYEVLQELGPRERDADLFEALFPVARRVVYFDLFGRRGFHEYQMIVSREAFPALASGLRRYARTHPTPIALASCKLFRGEQSQLRFDGDGVCLALDFARDSAGTRLAGALDGLVQELRGVPNVMKDSRLPREVVAACYPHYGAFRDGLRRFDPRRVYASEVSERLGL